MSQSARCLYSWIMLNVPFLIIIGAGFFYDIFQKFFADVTYITHTIFGLFLVTLLYTFISSIRLSHYLKYPEKLVQKLFSDPSMGDREKIESYLDTTTAFPRFMMEALIALGFFGTVVGVILGFQTFPAEIFSDPTKMQEFIQRMMVGFATELYTLLMGIASYLWLSVNVYLLDKHANRLYVDFL